jgi:hypothetical protein
VLAVRFDNSVFTALVVSDVKRQYVGYKMLQDSKQDIRCHKTVCWISDVIRQYAGYQIRQYAGYQIRRHAGHRML